MMKPLFRILLAAALGLASLPGFAASADELIQACEKLKRADDRATCLREAIKAVAASPAATKAPGQQELAVAAAESIMKALRRLTSAATVGINLRDYSQLVVTEAANIDEALRSVPEGQFRDAAVKSRQAYIDAREVWSASIRWRYASTFRSAVLPILRRYAIDTILLERMRDDVTITDMPIAYFLSPIWSAAKLEVAAADAAISSLSEPSVPTSSSSIADQPIVVDAPSEASPPIVRRLATANDQRVLLALKKIDESADTGAGFVEYARMISTRIAELDQALREIPDHDFRTQVVAARQAYIDAREVWSLSDQYQYLSLFAEAAGTTLRRYDVRAHDLNRTGIKEMRSMPKQLFLFPIWQSARRRIDNAEGSLLSADVAKVAAPQVETPQASDPTPKPAAPPRPAAPRKADASRR
jgi:hypothetical protein